MAKTKRKSRASALTKKLEKLASSGADVSTFTPATVAKLSEGAKSPLRIRVHAWAKAKGYKASTATTKSGGLRVSLERA